MEKAALNGSRAFNLKRYFFLLSLILMVLVTTGMALYLRHYSAEQLLKLERGRATSLAQVFENSLWPSFRPLANAQDRNLDRLIVISKSSTQRNAVIGLMQGTDVIKVKVYSLDGITIFSTDPSQVGQNKADNSGFQRARAGEAVSELTHRNSFDAFEQQLTDRDVISSYLPVHSDDEKVEGVIELYVDATPFVHSAAAQLGWLTAGISLLMLFLYLAQLLVVRHAARILDIQATQLADANRELDARVADRTRELSASNTQLHEEIQERKKVEQQLDRLAHHDPLTGLPNRLMFTEELRVSIERAEASGDGLTMMFIDLDRFKDINDTLGHFIGDQLLQAVTNTLVASVRHGDTLARFGGDEFVCILRNTHDSAIIVECADRMLACFNEPFSIGGNKLYLSASIGICCTPQDGRDVETLIRNADIAMYQAKAAGRNRYQFYTQEMSVAAEERRRLEERLRKAIEAETIDVHFQPKVAAIGGHLVSAEALARWNDDILGSVPPNRFIQVAEETGLIVPLGSLILEKVCRQIAAWRSGKLVVPRVFVNVSVKQLEQDVFCERLEILLGKYSLPASCLGLEITESVIMAADDAIGILERIRSLGVQLSIDDFGTGYSSLSYLKRLPVEELKIDRAFITGIGQNTDDEAIIRAIISLAESLGLSTVAEGVEDEQQANFLSAAGCQMIQGYHYGRPQAAESFKERLQQKARE